MWASFNYQQNWIFARPFLQWPGMDGFNFQDCHPVIFQKQQQAQQSLNRLSLETVKEIGTKKREKVGQKLEQCRQINKKLKMQLKKEREDNFERKNQKKNRNLPSNIFRAFISHLFGHPCPQKMMENISLSQFASDASSFLQQLRKYVNQTQSYIRASQISSLCRGQFIGEQYGYIFRILFKRFLLFQLPLRIVKIKKLTKKQKLQQFEMARRLLVRILPRANQ